MLIDKYDLYIFDWDGTLSTSSILVRLSRLLKMRYNVDYIRRHKEQFNTVSASDIRRRESMYQLYTSLYRFYSIFARPKMKEGSLELLKYLKGRRKRVAIFSDANKTRLFAEIRALRVIDYFDLVISADAIGHYKPDPTGVTLIASKYRVPKSRVMYIGDMASDVFTAKFAGVTACAIANGLDPRPVISTTGPDLVFDNIGQFTKRLKR